MVVNRRVLEMKRRKENETWSSFLVDFFFFKRIGRTEGTCSRNHKLCFDITHILSVVLGFFSAKPGNML
jgi:hypothetical protein